MKKENKKETCEEKGGLFSKVAKFFKKLLVWAALVIVGSWIWTGLQTGNADKAKPMDSSHQSTETIFVTSESERSEAERPSTVYVTSEPSEKEEEPQQNPVEGFDKVYLLSYIDGDTMWLYIPNKGDVKVRLIGVDTPESVAWNEYLERTGKENTEEGKDASKFLRNFFEESIDGIGGPLYIEYDVEEYDQYGRILAYLYLEDGTMIQDVLLSAGMARTMTIAPNVKYADHFVEVQRAAQEQKIGFWSGEFWTEAD